MENTEAVSHMEVPYHAGRDSGWVGEETTGTGSNLPRVAPMGNFLDDELDETATIDEVLVGEISLVGPRPELDEHFFAYQGEEKLILSVRPGITDYASIEFRNLNELVGSEPPTRYLSRGFVRRKIACASHTLNSNL